MIDAKALSFEFSNGRDDSTKFLWIIYDRFAVPLFVRLSHQEALELPLSSSLLRVFVTKYHCAFQLNRIRTRNCIDLRRSLLPAGHKNC